MKGWDWLASCLSRHQRHERLARVMLRPVPHGIRQIACVARLTCSDWSRVHMADRETSFVKDRKPEHASPGSADQRGVAVMG